MDKEIMPDEFLTNKEAAKFIRSSEVTLWRLRRDGLPFYRVQSKILYRRSDLETFLKENRQCSTQAAAA
jgi:hypothetical protein